MIDFLSLVKDTGAYKIISSERKGNKLSHAYLIISPDKESLSEYLKIFAFIIMSEDGDFNPLSRTKNLIENWTHPDVLKFPKKGESVLSDDVNTLIEESFLKPIESKRKLFVIDRGETMNLSAQNKLLKTLEEPPKNVHILIGATSEFTFLPTVLSRVKKLEIPLFSDEKLYEALKNDCLNEEKLKRAIACGDGTLGKAKALYGDEKLSVTIDYVVEVFNNMQSSKDVLAFSVKATENKIDVNDFLSVTELSLRELLVAKNGKINLIKNVELYNRIKDAPGFNKGAVNYILDQVTEARKRKKSNVNATVLTEWMLLKILEGKFKWRK